MENVSVPTVHCSTVHTFAPFRATLFAPIDAVFPGKMESSKLNSLSAITNIDSVLIESDGGYSLNALLWSEYNSRKSAI